MSTSCFRQGELPVLTIRAKQCVHPLRLSEQHAPLFDTHKGNSCPLFSHWLLITPNSLNVSCIHTNNDAAEIKGKTKYEPLFFARCALKRQRLSYTWVWMRATWRAPGFLGIWELVRGSADDFTSPPLILRLLFSFLSLCTCFVFAGAPEPADGVSTNTHTHDAHAQCMHISRTRHTHTHTEPVVSLLRVTSHGQTQCNKRKPCGVSFYCL